MTMRRPSEDARRRLLGELLSDDWQAADSTALRLAELLPSPIDQKIEDEGVVEFIAGGPLDEEPEFRQHECWRMLLVWPDDVDPTLPGKLECSGCGAVYRIEVEHRP